MLIRQHDDLLATCHSIDSKLNVLFLGTITSSRAQVRNLRQMFQTHSHAQPSPSQPLAIQEVQVHLLQQGFQRLIRSETTCSNSYWLDFTRLLSSQRLLDCEQNEQVLTAHSLGVKPYKCDFCEKSFTQRCSLESHQDKIHGVKCAMPYKKRRDKIYVCEECGFSTGDVRLVPSFFVILNHFSNFKKSSHI